jgi:hypothetical protein
MLAKLGYSGQKPIVPENFNKIQTSRPVTLVDATRP